MPVTSDPFHLQRFVDAQAGGMYEQALAELRAGRKKSHWMWFIFPQHRDLGRSEMARYYGLSGKDEAALFRPVAAEDDHIAVLGKGRKMLVFPLSELPEMARGKGVILQKDKLSDAKTFNWKEGLTYKTGSNEVKVTNLKSWLGTRAQAGKLPPNGFPTKNKFS